ncbi:hypothetical protein TNCV_1908801 [Trichonephila clavipes]|nr:hypothetical protein TNCV_1908801 [Trichonephila clavipes]
MYCIFRNLGNGYYVPWNGKTGKSKTPAVSPNHPKYANMRTLSIDRTASLYGECNGATIRTTDSIEAKSTTSSREHGHSQPQLHLKMFHRIPKNRTMRTPSNEEVVLRKVKGDASMSTRVGLFQSNCLEDACNKTNERIPSSSRPIIPALELSTPEDSHFMVPTTEC